MEHIFKQSAGLSAPVRPPTTVTVLQCRPVADLDPAPLNRILAEKGEIEAEDMICRVLEDIAYRLDALQCAATDHEFVKIAVPARRIGQVASQIGMVDVALTADHVATAARDGDGVALSATLARLERGFDAAVNDIWSFRNQSQW